MAVATQGMVVNLATGLLARLSGAALKALIEIEVTGEAAAKYYVELDGKPTLLPALPQGRHPDVIFKGDQFSLAALLEGRMSFSDAFVTGRVSLAGDVVKIVQLKQALIPKTS